jgi:glycolate oxidase FAD binding subunit
MTARDVTDRTVQLGERPSGLLASSTADVVGAVQDAITSHHALRVIGAGTWLHAGRAPVRPVRPLSLVPLTGIVDYEPGDLTLTARAGTTLADLDVATRPHGQWLPLDPVAAPGATLGATLATASDGPLAQTMGRVRDHVLGVEFVTGDGRVARGGGRVVKNVAGFDLVRLQIGAWGSLGVITEITVRLRARPEHDETLLFPCSPESLGHLVDAIRGLPGDLLACELLPSQVARLLELPAVEPLGGLVRLGGNEEAVQAQRAGLAALADVQTVSSHVWTRLATPDPDARCTLRLSALPSRFVDAWSTARSRLGDRLRSWQASPLRGLLRATVDAGDAEQVAQTLGTLGEWGMQVVIECGPAPLWRTRHDDPTRAHLSASLRAAFDPHQVLNPGIVGSAPASADPAPFSSANPAA